MPWSAGGVDIGTTESWRSTRRARRHPRTPGRRRDREPSGDGRPETDPRSAGSGNGGRWLRRDAHRVRSARDAVAEPACEQARNHAVCPGVRHVGGRLSRTSHRKTAEVRIALRLSETRMLWLKYGASPRACDQLAGKRPGLDTAPAASACDAVRRRTRFFPWERQPARGMEDRTGAVRHDSRATGFTTSDSGFATCPWQLGNPP